jgi:hypothetical protein
MQYPRQRIQGDVKVVPKACILDKSWKNYYKYTVVDEYGRMRYLEGFQTADPYASGIYIEHALAWFRRKGIEFECVQTDKGFEFTKRFQKTKDEHIPSLFEPILRDKRIKH